MHKCKGLKVFPPVPEGIEELDLSENVNRRSSSVDRESLSASTLCYVQMLEAGQRFIVKNIQDGRSFLYANYSW